MERVTRRSGGAALGGLATLLAGAACGVDTRRPTEAGPIGVGELTPQPNLPPEDTVPNLPPRAPGDVQVLPVEVRGGAFGSERYEVQAGAVQLRVTTSGGPYGLRIDGLMQARVLPADKTSAFGLTATPGDYTMRLDTGTADTAVLHVRAVGAG